MKSTICHISDEPLEGDKVRDHCHITGQLENKNPPCHRGPYPQPPSTPPSQPHSGVCPVLHLPRQRGELPAGPRSNHQGAVSESGHDLRHALPHLAGLHPAHQSEGFGVQHPRSPRSPLRLRNMGSASWTRTAA